MKVIIDNGHGVETEGKNSPKGLLTAGGVALYEYASNRDIANRLFRLLYKAGIRFVQLVPEVEDVPLHIRCDRANNIFRNHPGSFLISIHSNLGGGRGLEYFTYFGESESDKIAEIFAQEAKISFPGARLRTDTTDGDSDKEANFAMLRDTIGAAVLTENFFMDEPRDLALLLDCKFRQRIAEHHFNSIVKYIKSVS